MEIKKKIWLLRPAKGLDPDDNPWVPWYDKAFGFVVVACTEQEARKFANDNGGDEKYEREHDMHQVFHSTKRTPINPWLDCKLTTCVELTADIKEGVVIIDFASA